MVHVHIEGVPDADLEKCIQKVEELERWAKQQEKVDRWAFRAALLKTLYADADDYFLKEKGTFREIAAFDNGVAHTLEELSAKEKEKK